VRRSAFFLLVAILVLVAGCSSSSNQAGSPGTTGAPGTPVPTTSDARGGVPVGYPTDIEALSPLVITALAPDPIPVTGTDGKVHVVYELEVLNFSPRVATLTRLETLDGGPDGKVVASVEGTALAARTVVAMDPKLEPNPVIPVGRTGLILVDDVYDSLAAVPALVTHRLSATFAPLTPEYQEGYSRLWPAGDSVSQIGGPVTTSTESALVIGPPLAGSGWLLTNGCCGFSTHRALLPYAGRINAGERFAIDWAKVDPTADPRAIAAYLKPAAGGVASRNEDYLSYGEPVLAVADGTVVTVVSDTPDSVTETGALPTDVGFADLGGNVVLIDIGNGVYASYFHLAPGSPTVKVGDKVTRGQVIGRLGNSGNSSGPHLHFQLQRSRAAHLGDNVPFEINTFTYVGSVDEVSGFAPGPNAGARTDQLPLAGNVVEFPAAP
jgi:Peptidase family M23